jgi:DNA helicase-2/ATP-dependent DNA helicase PcrA
MEWSSFQSAIFAAVANDESIIVNAVPGSGKSTTLEAAIHHTWEGARILVVAFNTAIVKELKSRIKTPGVEVCTLNGYGYARCIAKWGTLVTSADAHDAAIKAVVGGGWERREWVGFVKRVVSLAKATMSFGVEELDTLVDDFDVAVPKGADREHLVALADDMLAKMEKAIPSTIDFDDQIWLCALHDLKPIRPYDFIFVDEAQDLNEAQCVMLANAAGPETKFMVVGDPRQAIYGYRGAGQGSMKKLAERFRLRPLPLSISYRCAASIVALAAHIEPSIQARPDAPRGTVSIVTYDFLHRHAATGNFVVSRTNAPLIAQAWKWLSQGTPCCIAGKNDVLTGLAKWVKAQKAKDIGALQVALVSWEVKETERLATAGRSIQNAIDKADCLRALMRGCCNPGDVIAKIDTLTAATESGTGIQLMTTHKAKGLEADTVWLLRDTYCAWDDGVEEQNLLYVGITRAKDRLYLVRKELK